MDHTEKKAREFNRERERRGDNATLELLSNSESGYAPIATITTDWYAKKVSRVPHQEGTFFEIKIAESETVREQVGVKQVETLTVVGIVTVPGDAELVVTAEAMTNSPKSIPVAVLLSDSAAAVAGKVRTALAADADVSGFFDVAGSGANVVLTAKAKAANDGTMNIAIDNDTCDGLTPVPASTNTVPGRQSALQPVFDDEVSHARVNDRYYTFIAADEPRRATRVWLVSCEPTGQRKPA